MDLPGISIPSSLIYLIKEYRILRGWETETYVSERQENKLYEEYS